MKNSFDLSQLQWTLAGFNPYEWKISKGIDIDNITVRRQRCGRLGSYSRYPGYPGRRARFCSKGLLDAGILPRLELRPQCTPVRMG